MEREKVAGLGGLKPEDFRTEGEHKHRVAEDRP
jgi:hypothetical protein